MSLTFEWDGEKAKENVKKHRVSFHEAAPVFHDPFIATMPDPDHSLDEQRYISVGHSSKGRLLVVASTEHGDATRIISCRRAAPAERRIYEKENP
jgi:hypothetical protein